MTQSKTFQKAIPKQKFGATSIAAALALSAGVLSVTADHAQAQDLCTEYTVVRGDTLSQIASRASVSGGFQFLFDANTDVLESPNLLEVGQVLKIPCADGSLPSGGATSVVSIAVPASAPTPATDRAATFVTASGYAPFTDEDLPEGGMITQMVKR